MANFGILQPIQPGQVMGSISPTPAGPGAGDAIGSLLKGITGGMQQGQQMEAQKQQMDFNKQNNPLILQANQQKLQEGNLDIQTKKLDLKTKEDAVAYSQKVQEAAQQGEQQYLQALMPDARIDYLTKKANYNKTIAETVKVGAETGKIGAEGQKQQLTNAYIIQDSIGAANSSALQYQDPKQQEQAYQQVKKTLPSDIQKLMSPNFDPSFAPIAITTGTQAHAKFIETQFGDKNKDQATPDMKNSKRLAELDDKEAKGTITPVEQKEKARLETATTKAESATGLEAGQNLVDKLQTEYNSFSDKNSPEAKRVQEKLQQAQGKVGKETSQGLIKDTVNSVSNFIFGNDTSSKTPAPAAIPDGRVTVISPDGTIGHIPKAQLQEAIKAGYKTK